MTSAFIHGLILAFGLILPLGVQNFFVFSQGATNKRFLNVVPVVLTASLCDTLLILLAVCGVSLVVMSFAWLKTLLIIGGVLFLIYMGIMSWRSKPDPDAGTNKAAPSSLGRMISFTLMLSLLNPHAILDTVGVIGSSSLEYQGSERAAYTAACILVSWCWFFALAIIGRLIGHQDRTGRFTRSLNKVSAIVMWLAAIYLIRTF